MRYAADNSTTDNSTHYIQYTCRGYVCGALAVCQLLQAACRSGKDKALHDLITADILPQLIESAAARRRAEEKQAAIEAMPKKRSSRLQVHHPLCTKHMRVLSRSKGLESSQPSVKCPSHLVYSLV